jgi:hypothetical protein
MHGPSAIAIAIAGNRKAMDPELKLARPQLSQDGCKILMHKLGELTFEPIIKIFKQPLAEGDLLHALAVYLHAIYMSIIFTGGQQLQMTARVEVVEVRTCLHFTKLKT